MLKTGLTVANFQRYVPWIERETTEYFERWGDCGEKSKWGDSGEKSKWGDSGEKSKWDAIGKVALKVLLQASAPSSLPPSSLPPSFLSPFLPLSFL